MNEVIDFAAEGGGDGEFASKNLDAYLAVGANTGSAAGELREKFVRIVAEVDRMAGADGAASGFVAQQIGGVVGNEGPSRAGAGIGQSALARVRFTEQDHTAAVACDQCAVKIG